MRHFTTQILATLLVSIIAWNSVACSSEQGGDDYDSNAGASSLFSAPMPAAVVSICRPLVVATCHEKQDTPNNCVDENGTPKDNLAYSKCSALTAQLLNKLKLEDGVLWSIAASEALSPLLLTMVGATAAPSIASLAAELSAGITAFLTGLGIATASVALGLVAILLVATIIAIDIQYYSMYGVSWPAVFEYAVNNTMPLAGLGGLTMFKHLLAPITYAIKKVDQSDPSVSSLTTFVTTVGEYSVEQAITKVSGIGQDLTTTGDAVDEAERLVRQLFDQNDPEGDPDPDKLQKLGEFFIQLGTTLITIADQIRRKQLEQTRETNPCSERIAAFYMEPRGINQIAVCAENPSGPDNPGSLWVKDLNQPNQPAVEGLANTLGFQTLTMPLVQVFPHKTKPDRVTTTLTVYNIGYANVSFANEAMSIAPNTVLARPLGKDYAHDIIYLSRENTSQPTDLRVERFNFWPSIDIRPVTLQFSNFYTDTAQ
ncbi:MAG: hypothetical protein IPJ88_02980 [Myxococcales bacterium]|nr:MAG: hypothetical protein IPJ88_02980 [Myxococcales bacterium]